MSLIDNFFTVMNQIFSFKRYAALMKCQLVENKKIYLWGIGVFAVSVILLFAGFGDWKPKENPRSGQEEVFRAAGFICLLFFAGTFFESLGSKYKRMFYFSLPTSPTEKTATAFVSVMILCPLVFTGIYYCADYFAVQFFNSIHGTDVKMYNIFSIGWDDFYFTFLLISVFALCSFMFGKLGILKTTGILFAVVFLFFYMLPKWIFGMIVPVDVMNSDYTTVMFKVADVQNQLHANNFFTQVGYYLLAPLCWVVYWFKVKEKEA